MNTNIMLFLLICMWLIIELSENSRIEYKLIDENEMEEINGMEL